MTIEWIPCSTDGTSWKAFAVGAKPGLQYQGIVRFVGPGHYRATMRHGSMYSGPSIITVARWLVEAFPDEQCLPASN